MSKKKILLLVGAGSTPLMCAVCLIGFLFIGLFMAGGSAPQPDQSVETGFTSFMLPRWVCPSVTPVPTRIKEETPDPTPGTPTAVYYEEWEQEYGLPPMTPTPYYKEGSSFFSGQYIEISQQVFVKMTYDQTATANDQHLVLVRLNWTNRSGGDVSIHPNRQIAITAIKGSDGRKQQGQWVWTRDAAIAAGLPINDEVETTIIPVGEKVQILPILIPRGGVEQIEVRIDPPGAVNGNEGSFRVQFTNGIDPQCTSQEGVLTGLPHDPNATVQPMPIPPGTDQLVASALTQVGRQYCWGGKGYQACSGCAGGQCVTPPCTSLPCFDCSGLTWWAYYDNGVTIGHGTSNQQNYPQVAFESQAEGDLALFTTINSHSRAGITHVGILGDINDDGKMDMIHAANYPDGVIIEMDVWSKRYYRNNLILITRPPRGSGQ